MTLSVALRRLFAGNSRAGAGIFRSMYVNAQSARVAGWKMAATRLWPGMMRTVRVTRILKAAQYACARCNMENFTSTTGESGDLFGKIPIPRGRPAAKGRLPPELIAARALCHQLRRTWAPQDKQRIAHLICLNLLSMLRHGS